MVLQNKQAVLVSGQITSGPDTKETKSGKTVTSMSVRYGYDKEASTGRFIHVSIWGEAGIEVERLYKKGDQILVAGRLETYEYDGKKYSSLIADFTAPGTGVFMGSMAAPADTQQRPV